MQGALHTEAVTASKAAMNSAIQCALEVTQRANSGPNQIGIAHHGMPAMYILPNVEFLGTELRHSRHLKVSSFDRQDLHALYGMDPNSKGMLQVSQP